MIIDLTELLSNEGKVREVEAEYSADYFKSAYGRYQVIDKKPLSIKLTNIGNKSILIETEIILKLIIPCDRCLTEVTHAFDIEVSKEANLNDTDVNDEDSEEMSYLVDGKLDVDKLVYEELLVNLPAKTLCKETCKGLCKKCGKNLNFNNCDCDTEDLDPRMAKIRDIFRIE